MTITEARAFGRDVAASCPITEPFVSVGARALIRARKAGVPEPLRRVVVESATTVQRLRQAVAA